MMARVRTNGKRGAGGAQGPSMPGEQEPSLYEVLAVLVASLRRELAEMAGVLAQARTELASRSAREARTLEWLSGLRHDR
jgi:hypothetical protein